MASDYSARFPIGARVHHGNQLWTGGWTEDQRRANPQWGWGTVVEVETRHADASRRAGDVEVKVRYDAPMFSDGSTDGPTESWWPAWLIDEVHSS